MAISAGIHGQLKEEKVLLAKNQINELKASVILVRLNTKQRGIEALKNAGNNKLANKIEQQVKQHNLSYMAAFRSEFSFCPVYFFESPDSEFILKKQYEKATIYDAEKKNIPFSALQDQTIFIAEVTEIENTRMGTNTAAGEAGQKELGFEALILKDNQFTQLKSPLPFYQRTFTGVFFLKKKPEKVVATWNQRLNLYYEVYKR